MDLSVYITELLNENGTISIPNIGVFKQVRKRGYYNTDEGKLYPPYFQTEFEHQAVTNDELLQYLIEKSKVSPASARFFIDRYVQNILQQAELGEAMIGRIGWLSKGADALTFRPALNQSAESAAFGFAPVTISTEAETVVAPPTPVQPQPEESAPVVNEEIVPAVKPKPVAAPEETAPVVNEEIAPATEPTPAAQPEETAPVVNDEIAPVAEPTPAAQPEETAPVVNEDIAPVTEPVAQTPPSAEPETPVAYVNEPVAPAAKFSIEKELAQQPQAEPVPEPVPQPKAPISPLVRQHKPAPKPQPVAEPAAPAPVVMHDERTSVILTGKPEVNEDSYTEPEKPFYLKPWFYGAAIMLILAAGAILVLKNDADNDNKAKSKAQPSTATPVVKSTPSTDSVVVRKTAPDTVVIRSQPVTDSAVKNRPLPPSTEFAPEVETPTVAVAHPIVNSNNYKFVLIGGSYGTYEQALAASGRYKTAGISASPFENSRKLWKVALGYYKTYTEGQEAKKELVKQGKVLTWKLYVETLRK